MTTSADALALLELLVTPADRRAPTLCVVLCDAERRPVQPCVVDDVPTDASDEKCQAALSPLAAACADLAPDGCLLVGWGRPGGPTVTDCDRRWFRAAHDLATAVGLGVVGVFLLCERDARELVLDDVL